MTLLVFAHANGFPTGTYTGLLRDLEMRGYTVRAPDRLGHDPRYPVTNNWRELERELSGYVQKQVLQTGEAAYLVGHSLGGFLSLACALRHPMLTRGLVLLDSPILAGWRARMLWMAKRLHLTSLYSPGSTSRRRRQVWDSREDVLRHFQHKHPFVHWESDVLAAYVALFRRNAAGEYMLPFDRTVETHVYDAFPDNLDILLARRPPQCPIAYIGGTRSREAEQLGLARTLRLTDGRWDMVEGSHLFPMERPALTAERIDRSIRSMSA